MSPTLLEGVAVLVVLAVAWQIGVRLAPDIMSMARRAINQLYGNYPSQIDQGETKNSSPQKELKNDTENQSNQ
ncbi:MAG: hypothetical protein U0350_41600 [Caldilineaceae bacterium]